MHSDSPVDREEAVSPLESERPPPLSTSPSDSRVVSFVSPRKYVLYYERDPARLLKERSARLSKQLGERGIPPLVPHAVKRLRSPPPRGGGKAWKGKGGKKAKGPATRRVGPTGDAVAAPSDAPRSLEPGEELLESPFVTPVRTPERTGSPDPIERCLSAEPQEQEQEGGGGGGGSDDSVVGESPVCVENVSLECLSAEEPPFVVEGVDDDKLELDRDGEDGSPLEANADMDVSDVTWDALDWTGM
jgi:hypothetical protein